jgi:hypothetical protein
MVFEIGFFVLGVIFCDDLLIVFPFFFFSLKRDVHFFLDSINHRGVDPRAFKMLDALAHDHQLTLKEFQSWLVIATKVGLPVHN